MRDKDEASAMRKVFWALWTLVLLLKLAVAAKLPLFVDEAFYWQEGRHPAAAYSDLPGLTAWLARLGVELGGNHTLALRAPFLLIAALVPWLLARIAAREFGERSGWLAGCYGLLLPLSGTLGVLALPDAMMALATLLCLDAGARLLREVDARSAVELAAGLALGALSHYRFIAVIGVGFVALMLLPEGRRALRDVRVIIAVAIGASAWAPLVAWNMDNADAGLRFQLVERHPWSFHVDGLWFVAIQALLVTPLLFAALALAGWRGARDPSPVTRYLALLGSLVVLGFFVLGFFADTERVSFHWPLPGFLALLPLLPMVLARWPGWARGLTAGLAGATLLAMLGYYVAVSMPELRARSAGEKWYPSNFAGWDELARKVRARQQTMPAGTRIVADNFKVGAELGFALDDPRIAVLDHPINHKHGRAPQLRLWGLHSAGRADWDGKPVLLVVGVTEVEYKNLLQRYHDLCAMVGPLPPPQTINIDHGRQRFALFAFDGKPREGACTTPAMAWVDTPAAGSKVGREFQVGGWAFKDGVGLQRVEVMLDGRVVAQAEYGGELPGVREYWKLADGGRSSDPQHPKVAFTAKVALDAEPAGRHWLGLRLHGRDGSVEDWAEQPIEVGRR
ncbi:MULTISPECIES: ArnT family glycosyltransferase [Lysobacter]|uniref:ArnT family glycosyltransferase n=1 Tax=Lysobacter TaxID=68 RepID=UPI001F359797|nr:MULTISPECIES: glycosyltransferase family 39 protein [Lysobacter]UJB17538.1 glycosyltransferase family 39 protein [Lysobacter capsici]UJQ28739.1 glycosyltransferase family 39 protein [Lysobacter gummosus]